MATLDKEEAQLLAVYRAINEFDNVDLVDVSDVGVILSGLRAVVNLDAKEEELNSVALKALIYGFVAGIAATRAHSVRPEFVDFAPEAEFIGGPTGGVATGQGEDPAFVTQSGVHDNS